MAYASYEEYRTTYAGTLFTSEEQFLPFAERASDYMDSVTFGRLRSEDTALLYGNVQRQIVKCCCAIAENLYYYDAKSQPDTASGSKQSETIGKYSVTYANPLDSLGQLTGGTFAEYQHSTALRYLGSTGLMYRGVD